MSTRTILTQNTRRIGTTRFVVVATMVLALAGVVPVAAEATERPTDDFRGTYALDDGRILTMIGTARSSDFELDGVQVGLRSDGDDRFVASDDPGEVITVVRGADGSVVGIELAVPGEPVLTGERVTLYTEEPVAFTGPGAELAGTLLLPEGPGPHPMVVIVHGAEFGTREKYRLMATHFARRGVAALIYDRRGTGESEGSFAGASFDVLAADALAAVAAMRSRETIDADRVGLLGFSQGGWVIAMAALESDEVAFLIPVSASGFTPAAAAAWLSGNLLALRGLDERSTSIAARGWRMMYSSLQLVERGIMPPIPHVPGFWFHSLDPYLESADLWAPVRQPVLGIWGETDCQVPAVESAQALLGALRAGGNQDHTLRVLAGASHGIHLVEPCAHELGGMHHHGARSAYAPGFLEGPAEWIHSRETPRASSSLTLPETATESPLGWHQDPGVDAPWYGTLLVQMLALTVLLLAFGGVALAWVGSMTFGRRRLASTEPWTRNFAGFGAVAGFVGVVLALGGIAELLTLGDVHADFVWGGPEVDGVSPMLAAAAAVITTSIVLLGAAGMLEWVGRAGGQNDRRIPRRTIVAVAAGVMLAAWAGSWGVLSLPPIA
jgi:uncharacterized protein